MNNINGSSSNSIFQGVSQEVMREQALACENIASLNKLLEDGLDLSETSFVNKLITQLVVAEKYKICVFIITKIEIGQIEESLRKSIIDKVSSTTGARAINIQNERGRTNLHLAAQSGNADVIKVLLKNGGDPTILDYQGASAAEIAIDMGFQECAALLDYPDREKVREDVKMQKVFGHFTSRIARDQKGRTSNGREFNVEGGVLSEMRNEVAKLSEFFTEENAPIASALRNTSQEIEKGELGFIHAYWGECPGSKNNVLHGICLVFREGKMAICNRGSNPLSKPTITVFKIDSAKITPEILERIGECRSLSAREAANFFYQELPDLLSKEGERKEIELPTEFLPKDSHSGTCTMNSQKAAVKAALYFISGNLEKAHKDYKKWTLHSKMLLLREYIEGIHNNKFFLNKELLNNFFIVMLLNFNKHELEETFIKEMKGEWRRLVALLPPDTINVVLD